MRKLSSSQSLFFTVLAGFLLTLPVALWLRGRAQQPPPQQPMAFGTFDEIPGLRPGDSVAATTLNGLEGENVDLLKSEDGYLLLCFFSTECPKCADEAAVWKELIANGPQSQARTFLVATDKDLATLRGYLDAKGLGDLPVLFDPEGNVESHFKIEFLPQYLLFDRTGKVVHRELGYISAVGMEPAERAQAILGAIPSTKTVHLATGEQQ